MLIIIIIVVSVCVCVTYRMGNSTGHPVQPRERVTMTNDTTIDQYNAD